MGTCISKCTSAASEDCNPVQDKLVISQSPPLPSLPTTPLSKNPVSKNLQSLSPSSSSSPTPTISTTTTTTIATAAATTTTTTTTTSSSSVSSSSSSSSAISKDRSFSNEFLWSCIKENPQIIPFDQDELSPTNKKPSKFPISTAQNRLSKANVAPQKQSISGSLTPSKQPKKAKERSPSPVPQKSSRKEPERQKPISFSKRNLGSSSPIRRFNVGAGTGVLGSPQEAACKRQVTCRGLSPSPSRRFNGVAGRELLKYPQEENRNSRRACGRLSPSPSRRFERDAFHGILGNPQEKARKRGTNFWGLSTSPSKKFNGDMSKVGARFMGNGHFPLAVGKENLSLSPVNPPPSPCPCLKKRGSCMVRTHPQVDENVVADLFSNHDSNSSLSVEDIDNPLISLDCFIFL